jgi:hypothetical protein
MLDTLTHKSMDELRDARVELSHIHSHPHTPNHVKEAAAVLLNFYGAEMDSRMMRGEGQ